MTDNLNLNSFLRFGYFLNYNHPIYNIKFPAEVSNMYSTFTEDELASIGAKKLKSAIHNNFIPGRHNLVPLSGGIDSRAMLAGILELTEAKNITTFTFGTPGSQDFEIGRTIARKTGVKHIAFDLTKHIFTFDEMIETSKRIDHQSILFHHFPLLEVDKICNGSIVWSGAIIDVFFGRHYHIKKGRTLEEAKSNFIRENVYVSSTNISNISDELLFPLIEFDENAAPQIMYEHILDLINRQIKYVSPHVMPKGYDYGFLFQDKDLVQFSFDIELKYIEHQYLYKKMMLKAFPEIFRYKTKSNFGQPLNVGPFFTNYGRIKQSLTRALKKRIDTVFDPLVNYIDFNRGIRFRTDLKNIIYESIQNLKKRNIVPWVDIDKLWESHMKSGKNHADALIVLSSLEIHLQAGKQI